jgi:DNA helicase-2/ATP-dependent DNA helicase PcrA
VVEALTASAGRRGAPGRRCRRERWEALAALVQLAEEYAATPTLLPIGEAGSVERPVSLADFNDELQRRATQQHVPTVDGVTLASLHSAKGLEWDAVFLVGLSEGTLPTTYAKTAEQVEEERRLLYVGITRAREWLWLSYASARSPGGRARRPSRFLPQLDRSGGAERAGAAPVRRGERRRPIQIVSCRICGATLLAGPDRKLGRCPTCPSDIDEELFERLREWRLRVAGVQKVPSYVVHRRHAHRAGRAETGPDRGADRDCRHRSARQTGPLRRIGPPAGGGAAVDDVCLEKTFEIES